MIGKAVIEYPSVQLARSYSMCTNGLNHCVRKCIENVMKAYCVVALVVRLLVL